MKLCDRHWKALQSGIRERGLFDHVSKDAAEATERVRAAREAGNPLSGDPLIDAMTAIMLNSIHVARRRNMQLDTASDGCPLCVLAEQCGCDGKPCGFDEWIDKACDEQAEVVAERVAGAN